LAGVSSAPFRKLFYQFLPPSYAVTEMMSAYDVLTKHTPRSRYLYRAAEETRLCYQISGVHPQIMSSAALALQRLGADLIDINCGCPKAKIRKKGAGSALMDNPKLLSAIVRRIREQVHIPLTVKLRIHGSSQDVALAQMLEQAGADALIIHGRRWTDDYEKPSDFRQIGLIKQHVDIPVIANGDICDHESLHRAYVESGADGYMISRAGCGQPWLYQDLLCQPKTFSPCLAFRVDNFIQHVCDLRELESEYQAVMQSKTLIRYYFRNRIDAMQLKTFYKLTSVDEIASYLRSNMTFPDAQ
jgi:tRNA-dihydrouridine synthase B